MSVNIMGALLGRNNVASDTIKLQENTLGNNNGFAQVLNNHTAKHHDQKIDQKNAQTSDNPQTEQIKLEQPTNKEPNSDTQQSDISEHSTTSDEMLNFIAGNTISDMALDVITRTEVGLITDVPLADIAAIAPAEASDIAVEIYGNIQDQNITEILKVVAVEIPTEITNVQEEIALETQENMEQEYISDIVPVVLSEVKQRVDFQNVQVIAEPEQIADTNVDLSDVTKPAQNLPTEVPQEITKRTTMTENNGSIPVVENDSNEVDAPQLDITLEKQLTPDVAPITTSSPETQAFAASSNNNEIKAKALTVQQPKEFSIVESVKVETTYDADTNPEMQFSFDEQNNDEQTDIIDIENPKQGFNVEKPHSASSKSSDVKMADMSVSSENDVDMNSVSNEIKTAVQNLNSVNGKRVTIALNPDSLGEVTVELTIKDGKIAAIKIEAVKPETLDILAKSSQLLQETLSKVDTAHDASLSFNLKEGNHNNDDQQKAGKGNPLLAELRGDEDAKIEVVSHVHTDIYDVNGDTNSKVNIQL